MLIKYSQAPVVPVPVVTSILDEKEPDWQEALKDKLDPEIMKDEGCNPSGLYELFAVVTHQGASADSGHYCAYVKKDDSDGKTWYFFNDDTVTEVDQTKVETLYGGGMRRTTRLYS